MNGRRSRIFVTLRANRTLCKYRIRYYCKAYLLFNIIPDSNTRAWCASRSFPVNKNLCSREWFLTLQKFPQHINKKHNISNLRNLELNSWTQYFIISFHKKIYNLYITPSSLKYLDRVSRPVIKRVDLREDAVPNKALGQPPVLKTQLPRLVNGSFNTCLVYRRSCS